MSTSRRLTCAVLATSLTCLAGCNMWPQARFKETRQLMVSHEPGTGVDIQTKNGAIDVRVAQVDSVEIDAHLKAITQERLDLTDVVASRLEDGTLYLRVDWPEGGRRGSEGCSFDIRLPDAYGANLESSNGAITLVGISGEAKLRTSNGKIRVENHDGNVLADTSNGYVELAQITGAATVDTSNGAVRVELDDASSGPLSIKTSNGSVHVTVGPAFAGELGARTSNGRLKLVGFEPGEIAEQGRRNCRLQAESALGTAVDSTSSVRSSNGSITLTRRGG